MELPERHGEICSPGVERHTEESLRDLRIEGRALLFGHRHHEFSQGHCRQDQLRPVAVQLTKKQLGSANQVFLTGCALFDNAPDERLCVESNEPQSVSLL